MKMPEKEMFRTLEEAYQLIREENPEFENDLLTKAMARLEIAQHKLELSSEEMEKLTNEVIGELFGG